MNDRRLHDLGEDATGFGATELRTAWRSVTHPREVLEAYMVHGSTGGGLYTRPLRLYLGLCGLLMIMLFLMGGMDNQLRTLIQPELLADLAARSGKSEDAFLADADGWLSLVGVPLLSVFYALSAAPLLRWWDPEDLGWRRGFRATFAYLNAWTVLVIPIGWMSFHNSTALIGSVLMLGLAIVAFVRMGRDRWWRSPLEAVLKSVALVVAIQLGVSIGWGFLFAIGLLGGMYAP